MNKKGIFSLTMVILFIFSSFFASLLHWHGSEVSATSPTDTGNGNPEGDGVLENEGDWYIAEGEKEWYNDTTIIVNGNLFIEGSLFLNNVTLLMNLTEDGQHSIIVNESGSLKANNTNFTSKDFRYFYIFKIFGRAEVTNSTISKLWSKASRPYIGGVEIYSENASFINSQVHHNYKTGFYITKGAMFSALTIYNSTFGMVANNVTATITDTNFTAIWDNCLYLFNGSKLFIINTFLQPNYRDVTVKNSDENSSVLVSVYVDIGVFYANMTGIEGANIFCAAENGGYYYNFTTEKDGWARHNLLVKYIQTKSGSLSKENYIIRATKDNVTNETKVNIGDTNSVVVVLFGEGFGYAVSSGDINGDGLVDYAVSAPYNSLKQEKSGAVYLYYGKPGRLFQEFKKEEADEVIYGNTKGELLGYDLNMETDYNHDGYPDLVVSAPGLSGGKGRVFIYYGGSKFDTASPDFSIEKEGSTFFGKRISLADVDMDTLTDLVISDEEMSYVFYGSGAIPKSINLWDMEEDRDTPETDFTHGVNFTANTFGIDGDDDGWDWAEGNEAYGRSNRDMTTLRGGKSGTPTAGDGKTHDNSARLEVEVGGREDESMDSGAWGIKFYISSDIINDTKKDRKLYFQFKWAAYDREKFYGNGGTEEYVYIKARITNSTASYYLGEDYGGHSSEPKPNVWSHVQNQNRAWEDSGTFSTDLTSYLDGEGWYYLDFGAKFDARYGPSRGQVASEGIRAYFDDIFLYLSTTPFEMRMAEEEVLVNGDFNKDGANDGVFRANDTTILIYYGSTKGFLFDPILKLEKGEDYSSGNFDGTKVRDDSLQLEKKYLFPNGNFDNGWNNWTQKKNKRNKNNAHWEITTEEHGDWKVHHGPTASFGVHKDYVGGSQSDCDGRLESDIFTIPEGATGIRLWHHAKWASFEDAGGWQGDLPDEIELYLINASNDEVIDGVAYGPSHNTGGNGEREGYLSWDVSNLVGENVYIRGEISTNGGYSDCALLQLDEIEILGSPYLEYGNYTTQFINVGDLQGFLVECEKEDNSGEIKIKYRFNSSQSWSEASQSEHLNLIHIPNGKTQIQIRVEMRTNDENSTPSLNKLVLYGYGEEDLMPTIIKLNHSLTSKKVTFNKNVGDWNGDGYLDLVLGLPSEDKVYLFLGGENLSGEELSEKDAFATITGPSGSGFGRSLDFVGDVNNDGKDEILIGAPLHLGGRGSVYLFGDEGKKNYEPSDALAIFNGDEEAQQFGLFINGAGHVVSSSKARINNGVAERVGLYTRDLGIYNLNFEEKPVPASSTNFSGEIVNVGLQHVEGRRLFINITAYKNNTGSENGTNYSYKASQDVPALDVGESFKFNFGWVVPDFEDVVYNVSLYFDSLDYNPANDLVVFQVHSRFYKVEISSDEPSLSGGGGVALNFSLILKNKGNLGNDTVTLSSELPVGWTGDFYHGETVVKTVEVADTYSLNFSVTPPYQEEMGKYQLVVAVTSENGWRKTNFTLEFELLRPNLIVSELTFLREDGKESDNQHHIVVNETSTVKMRIENDGDVSTLTGFYVGLYKNGTLLQRKWTSSLIKNEWRYLVFSWKAEYGEHTLSVVVDDLDHVPEKEEGDNSIERTLEVKNRTPVGDYSLQGYVKNIYLEAVEDAVVTLSSEEWDEDLTTTTDENGYYSFVLKEDDYLDNQHLTVKAEKEGNTETKHIILYSEDEVRWLNLTLRHYDILLDYAGDHTASGEPGEKVIYLINVTNTGNTNDTLSLRAEALPEGWSYRVTGQAIWKIDEEYRLAISVDETITIALEITISSQMHQAQATKLYHLFLNVSSTNDTDVWESLPFYTMVELHKELKLTIEKPEQMALPFEEVVFNLTIENRGNNIRNVVLRVVGDYTEFSSLSQTIFNLSIYESKALTLTIYIPKVFDDGTLLSFGIGEVGGEILGYANVTMASFTDFLVEDSHLPAGENGYVEFIKDGAPGQRVEFKNKINNTGNTDLTLQLEPWYKDQSEMAEVYINGMKYQQSKVMKINVSEDSQTVLTVEFVLSEVVERGSTFVFYLNITAGEERFVNISYKVKVGSYYNFTLFNKGMVQDYTGKEKVEATVYIYKIMVKNNGNMPDTPVFVITKSKEWDVEFTPVEKSSEGVPFQPKESRMYNLTIYIPLETIDAMNLLNLTVFSSTEQKSFYTLILPVEVREEEHGIRIRDVKIFSALTLVENLEMPTFTYSIELENNGSVSERVLLEMYHPDIEAWYPVFKEKELTLRPGEVKSVSVRLLLPDDVNEWNGELSVNVKTLSNIEIEQTLNKPPFAQIDLNTGGKGTNDLTVEDNLFFSLKPLKDENKDSLNISWNMGDGTLFYSSSFNYQYKKFGSYEVVCSIKDEEGAVTILKKDLKIVNIEPEAKITVVDRENLTIPVYENFTLSAEESSDLDGEIVSYKWFLNEKLIGEGKYLTTYFEGKGKYSIVLEILDQGGLSDTTSIEIDIVEEEKPTSSEDKEEGGDNFIKEFMDKNDEMIEYITLGLVAAAFSLMAGVFVSFKKKKQFAKESEKELKEIEEFLKKTEKK